MARAGPRRLSRREAVDASGGWLSDRFGCEPAIFLSMRALLALILPCFWTINRCRTAALPYGRTALPSIPAGLGGAPIFTLIMEQVPMRIRSGTMAILYASTIAIFGDTTQFMETWLIRRTGSPLAPAFYWIAAVVLILIAIVLVREPPAAALQRHAAQSEPAG